MNVLCNIKDLQAVSWIQTQLYSSTWDNESLAKNNKSRDVYKRQVASRVATWTKMEL